jgi:hypothetical protein
MWKKISFSSVIKGTQYPIFKTFSSQNCIEMSNSTEWIKMCQLSRSSTERIAIVNIMSFQIYKQLFGVLPFYKQRRFWGLNIRRDHISALHSQIRGKQGN